MLAGLLWAKAAEACLSWAQRAGSKLSAPSMTDWSMLMRPADTPICCPGCSW